jgi:ribosomal protein S18 acetylase RimI-like enzyme
MSSITIRLATFADISLLQTINDQIIIDNPKYDPDLRLDWAQSSDGQKYFTDLVNDPRRFCFIVADGDKVIGYLAASPLEISYRLSRYLEIENMGILPEYKQKGIGTLLMHKLIEVAKNAGYQKLYVNSYIKNNQAVDFYKKSGFNAIDTSLEKPI